MQAARRALVVVETLVLLAAIGLVTASPAGATVPGRNGKIVFQRWGGDIWSSTIDGTDLRRLTFDNRFGPSTTPLNRDPAWSPTGTKIAFIRQTGAQSTSEIYVMNSDGSGKRRLTFNNIADVDVAWSPDGAQLAFVRRRPSGDSTASDGIYVMRVDGTGVSRLAGTRARDWNPAWSPDGRKIAVTGFPPGATSNDGRIYTIDLNGGGRTLLPGEPGDGGANWSPSGAKIAFTGSPVDIFVMNADGSGRTRLTVTDQSEASSWGPVWSPAGDKILYNVFSEDDLLVVMNSDGTDRRWVPIDDSPEEAALNALDPDWQARCTVAGTGRGEVLRGTPGQDLICAGGGNDTIFAGAGNDIVFGGLGDDRVVAGPGNDVINGGGGADSLQGWAGADRIWAKDGVFDRVNGGLGIDVCLRDGLDTKTACP